MGCLHSKARPCWDCYFIGVAKAVAVRADCRRRQYGAVIFKDNRIISSGYNGYPTGVPGCLEGHCPRGLLSYKEVAPLSSYEEGPGVCRALHAEQNALQYSSRSEREGGTMAVTGKPCFTCEVLLSGSGLVRVIYPDEAGLLVDCPL